MRTFPRLASNCTTGVFARVTASERRIPVAQASYPRSALFSGATLRKAQHRSGSRANRSLPCSASCSATVCSGNSRRRVTGYTASIASAVPIVSMKWYPVSRNSTSIPGTTTDARWTSTLSCMDPATANPGPNSSAAHRRISCADASANSRAPRSAITSSSAGVRSAAVVMTRSPASPGHRRTDRSAR